MRSLPEIALSHRPRESSANCAMARSEREGRTRCPVVNRSVIHPSTAVRRSGSWSNRARSHRSHDNWVPRGTLVTSSICLPGRRAARSTS